MSLLRLGVIPDYREEDWPSMDLVADRLLEQIRVSHSSEFHAESLCPQFKRRFLKLVNSGKPRAMFNADRFLNRMRDYPRHLKKVRAGWDCFHVCDHAYANAVHTLPADRTGVYCHDLDTFRCLFEKSQRPRWFKAMMRRVLSGLQKAAVIFHSTLEVRRQIVEHGIAEEARLVHSPYGVSSEFTPHDNPERPEPEVLRELAGAPFILHVGSCIARKRIDQLLEIFARARKKRPGLKLVQVGGTFTSAQREQIVRLKLGDDVIQAGRQASVADFYRRALAVLVPSEAEGFGLPVVEALACACVVVASAIPTLMEVGGDAAVYCCVGDVEQWAGTLNKILENATSAPTRESRLMQAAKYSWSAYAKIICDRYRKLCQK